MIGEGDTFLHGYLIIKVTLLLHSRLYRHLKVAAARDIPNMESWISTMYDKKVMTDNGRMAMALFLPHPLIGSLLGSPPLTPPMCLPPSGRDGSFC